LLDVLMQGANYHDDGFIADIHNSAKVWIAYTEYTISISESHLDTLLLSEFLTTILLNYKLWFLFVDPTIWCMLIIFGSNIH
jgi:hypothetical protein